MNTGSIRQLTLRNYSCPVGLNPGKAGAGAMQRMRKLIAFDDDTFDKLKQLGRDRMATVQELADEAFVDLLKKHGIPVDLKDALRKSASLAKAPAKRTKSTLPRKTKT